MDNIYNLITEHAIICFSHLRWNLVYQRPHHLMTRFATLSTVFYIEEPVFTNESDHYDLVYSANVAVVTPRLADAPSDESILHASKIFCEISSFRSLSQNTSSGIIHPWP
jgi:hypothetical protein